MVFRVKVNTIDWYSAPPTTLDPTLPVSSSSKKRPPVPILRVFGATESGKPVLAHVHGVLPYMYIEFNPSNRGNITSNHRLDV